MKRTKGKRSWRSEKANKPVRNRPQSGSYEKGEEEDRVEKETAKEHETPNGDPWILPPSF